jgi:prepilin-type N-terminal cleavage/methylation domain-containing protein
MNTDCPKKIKLSHMTPNPHSSKDSTPPKAGFTLIELLIVIGILAILATVVVLVLNPTEMFKQARDSQRLSETDALNQAILLYQTNGGSKSGRQN